MLAAIVTWMLVVYGVTLVITQSKIAKPLRQLLSRWQFTHDLIVCPMCVGFWVGVCGGKVGALLAHSDVLMLTGSNVMNGFAASGACWIIHVVMVRLGASEL